MYAVYKLDDLQNDILLRKFAQLNIESIHAIQDRPVLCAPQYIRNTASWRKELQDDHLTCWICIAPNAKTGKVSLEEGQWVGIQRLHGPLKPAEYNSIRGGSLESEADEFCTRWYGGRLYIKPDHRNVDVGNLLYRTATEYLASQTQLLLGPSLATGTEKHATIRVVLVAYLWVASHGMLSGGTVTAVRQVTKSQYLEYAMGLQYEVPAGLLHDDDYTKPEGTVFESLEQTLVRG